MGNILTSEQRTALKSRYGNERDRRVCDRIKAVLLYDKGWSYEEIAEALLLSEEAIYFMDSVHPQYQTKARYGWIRKNQNKTLATFSGWKTIKLLVMDTQLPKCMRDHPLIGNWKDHRDCHIKPDLVLIYRKLDANTLELIRLKLWQSWKPHRTGCR